MHLDRGVVRQDVPGRRFGTPERDAAPTVRIVGVRTRWIGAGVVLAAFVGGGVFLTLRDNARPVSLDEAKDRTHSSTEPSDDPATARPEPGVYRYEGSGTESISVPPLSQKQGPTMPGTVELGDDGCWTFRIDFSTNHWQTWDHCPEGDDLVETGGQAWQRWMIGATAITNLSNFTCDAGAMLAPAEPTPGDEWDTRCVGTNEAVDGESVSEGTYRFLGEEAVAVGKKDVTAHHFLRERTMSGAQVGTERTEVWYAADSGLILRNERTVEARSDTPIGPTTYSESGEFHLVEVDPA